MMSAIRAMPDWPTSSSRPTNGLTKGAPAFAPNSACAAEKHSVTLTIVPSDVSFLQARSPSGVSGTLIVTFFAISRRIAASRIMPSYSVAATSALTGPGTVAQISRIMSVNFLSVFATRDGLVVTPSSNPLAASDLISAGWAVSTKNFIVDLREGPTELFNLDSTRRVPRQPRRVPVMLPYPFPGPFDYRVPEDLAPEPGDLVLVPLNSREEVGVVWDVPNDAHMGAPMGALGDAPPVPERKLRSIIAVIDTPPMRSDVRRLIDWIAAYTLSPPGEVMRMALRVQRPETAPAMGWLRVVASEGPRAGAHETTREMTGEGADAEARQAVAAAAHEVASKMTGPGFASEA